jgi:hypothetical protein
MLSVATICFEEASVRELLDPDISTVPLTHQYDTLTDD